MRQSGVDVGGDSCEESFQRLFETCGEPRVSRDVHLPFRKLKAPEHQFSGIGPSGVFDESEAVQGGFEPWPGIGRAQAEGGSHIGGGQWRDN